MMLHLRHVCHGSTRLINCVKWSGDIWDAIRSQTRKDARALYSTNVSNEDITKLAAKPLYPITLADLVKYSNLPLSDTDLLSSANYSLSILPSRLAHRISSLRKLPFIVVSNPNIYKIHNNYVHSLSTLLPWAEREIKTVKEETEFAKVLAEMVNMHSNTISLLAQGFLESRRYVDGKQIAAFLNEHLRARIGTRLIAEQHIALHFSSKAHRELGCEEEGRETSTEGKSSYVGIIDTELKPADVVRHCEGVVSEICELKYGVRPSVTINGEPDYTFAHIPMHLEYIITELLKNAFRATIERGNEREKVEVTIAPLQSSEDDNGSNRNRSKSKSEDPIFSDSEVSNQSDLQGTYGVTIRIRDRGGGISPTDLSRIWDYSFTTFNDEGQSAQIDAKGPIPAERSPSHVGPAMGLGALSGAPGTSIHSLAGLGYGLPLGRAYAEYFGGGIAIQSLWGWGTDVYLSLRGVG